MEGLILVLLAFGVIAGIVKLYKTHQEKRSSEYEGGRGGPRVPRTK